MSGSPTQDPGEARALAESRARWRDLAVAAFDLTFETDAGGRFVLLGPDEAFGWQTARLLGLPAEALLVQAGGVAGCNPFAPPAPLRRHRSWIRRADGSAAPVLVSSHPLLDEGGAVAGARGAVQDVGEPERRDRQVAAALLLRQTVKEIDRRMRRAVLPDMVIKIGLGELLDATGSAGAVLVASDGAGPEPRILHRAGGTAPEAEAELVARAVRAAEAAAAMPATLRQAGRGCRLMLAVSAAALRFSGPVVLVLWRDAAGHDWIDGDEQLAGAFLATLGNLLEYDQVQRELSRQSGADALTGLLNRDSFAQEVNRRLDRLDGEGLPATLMLVGLDRFREVNEARGHETGDQVLRQAAHLLRDAVRPTDLVARLGSDVFALWLDGADQFAAAERAEAVCQKGVLASLDGEKLALRVSVGLASRPSRAYEAIDSLLEQAQAALGAVKLAGGGRWHFYNEGSGA